MNKKIMCVLLALTMLFSIMAIGAVAEDTENVPVDELEETQDQDIPDEDVPVDEEEVADEEELVEEDVPEEEAIEEELVEEEVVDEEETSDEEPADEVEEESLIDVDEETIEEAGVTPDSGFLWELEKAMEQLDLLLTFDESEEALKEIEMNLNTQFDPELGYKFLKFSPDVLTIRAVNSRT